MSTPALRKKPLASALALPAGVAPADAADAAGQLPRRVRLWQLEDKHHCPLIGTCLPVDELGKLARKFFPWVDVGSAFAMHVEAVNQAKTRNPVSEAIEASIARKYQAHVSRWRAYKSDDEVLAAWHAHYARGDVAGALWATITHRATSNETRLKVFADIHMLSHQIGAGLAADARRVAGLEVECVAARSEIERLRKSAAESDAALRRQLHKASEEGARLPALLAEIAALRERLAAFESGAPLIEMGRKLLTLQAENAELIVAAQRGWVLEKTLRAAHAEAQSLARERDQLRSERDALERLLTLGDAVAYQEIAANVCDGRCEQCDPTIAGQCVLYVGGRSALLAQYRALAARLGIRLLHHDGGIEESLTRLPEMIGGADAVVCPTDCVSHSAYYQLKRQCKRSGKPCLLFKGAGISGFAVALARLAAGQFSLPAAHGGLA